MSDYGHILELEPLPPQPLPTAEESRIIAEQDEVEAVRYAVGVYLKLEQLRDSAEFASGELDDLFEAFLHPAEEGGDY